MLLSICLASLASFASITQDPVAELRAQEHAAFELWVDEDLPAAMRCAAAATREAAERLAALPDPGSDEAAELADEIEFALIQLSRWSEAANNLGVLRELLDGVAIDPRHGSAFAALAWLRKDCPETLGLLLDWQFIGPFDNERGGGMKRRTPPESEPDSQLTHSGKVRDVNWRTLPLVVPAYGIVSLGTLVDPYDQICVLARSWIESPAEGPVFLMLGADEEIRVWLNGKTVFDALGIHSLHEDAFCVPLELRAGWNELTLKVGGREKMPRFVARLVDVERGSPLRLLQTAELPEGITAHELSRKRPPKARRDKTAVRPGIWSRVEALRAAGDSAEAEWRYSVLQYYFRPAAEKELPGRDAAARAAELDPSDLRFRIQDAITLVERGSTSAERDVNPWLHAIDAILELSPDLPKPLLWRARHAWSGQRTVDRALELVDRVLERRPDSITALSLRARILAGIDQHSLARRVRKVILEHEDARFQPGRILSAIGVLPLNDPRRLPLYDQVIAANENYGTIVQRARRRRFATGDRSAESALSMLDELLAADPWSINAHVDVAELLLATDHPGEAQGVITRALFLAPEFAKLHALRARACLQRGDTEGAVAALERELELDYSAADERRLLEHLRSLGAEPFHVTYQEPLAAILDRHAAAEPLHDGDVSRELLLERVVVEVQPDGTAKRYRRHVQRVLNETGIRALDRIPIRAWGGDQEVRVLVADVHRADGTVLHAPTGRGGRQGGMWVDFPPLEVGDVIDLEFRLDDLHPTFFGQYFGMNHRLSPDPGLPLYESEVVVIATEELPLAFHTRNFTGEPETRPLDDGQVEHRWRLEGWKPLRTESSMPPADEVVPAVQASSYESWEEFGSWWWNLIEAEITVSPEMTEKVAELTAEANTVEEKIRAIYDFVVTDIRYNAWEFGVHGYQPYSAPVIFSRGFGDCKDKAILLRALLSEVGVEAYPVLIRLAGRRAEEDHTLALVEHFNHCIAFVPEQEGTPELFLDGTARHHPLGIVPASDNGARVVIVKPDGVEARRIAFASATENRIDNAFRVTVTDVEDTRVELSQRGSGRYDPSLRGRYSGSDEERAERAEREMSSLFGALSGGVDVSFTDLEDLSTAVEVRFTASPERLVRPNERGYELPRVFDKGQLMRGLARETERSTDLLQSTPFSKKTTIEYILPPGHEVADLPPPVRIDGEDLGFAWEAEVTETGVRIRELLELKTHRIPAERYAELREACRQVDAVQESFLQVEVKP